MPFYEYQCHACGHRLEALQKISDEPLLYCPECGEPSLKRLISKAAFRLKGGGWYETDFKHSGTGKKSKKSGESGDSTESTEKKDGASDSGKSPASDSSLRKSA